MDPIPPAEFEALERVLHVAAFPHNRVVADAKDVGIAFAILASLRRRQAEVAEAVMAERREIIDAVWARFPMGEWYAQAIVNAIKAMPASASPPDLEARLEGALRACAVAAFDTTLVGSENDIQTAIAAGRAAFKESKP